METRKPPNRAGKRFAIEVGTELNFEQLPGIPPIWIDLLQARTPFLAAPGSVHALAEYVQVLKTHCAVSSSLRPILSRTVDPRFSRVVENVQRLYQPGSVAVVANVYASLLGGPAFQILKCLTAAKICERLAGYGHSAIPVCWILDSAPPGFSKFSVQILDHESEIRLEQVEIPSALNAADGSSTLPDAVSDLVARIEKLGNYAFDPEVLGILRASFRPGATLAQGSAHLMSALMEAWGVIVVDPGVPELLPALDEPQPPAAKARAFLDDVLHHCRVQRAVLPVAAHVVDPFEISAFAGALPTPGEANRTAPLTWPQASATVVDGRTKRILEKYRLDPARLYSGPDWVAEKVLSSIRGAAGERLGSLARETEEKSGVLLAAKPAGKRVGKAAEAATRKIIYQLNRLKEHLDGARERKAQTVSRHLRRACNAMAPNGHLQEHELAGIQIPLRYSRAALRSLYEKLDISSLEHQLIDMD